MCPPGRGMKPRGQQGLLSPLWRLLVWVGVAYIRSSLWVGGCSVSLNTLREQNKVQPIERAHQLSESMVLLTAVC